MRVQSAYLATCACSLVALFLGCGEDEVFSPTNDRQGGSAAEPSRREVTGEDASEENDAAVRRWVLLTKNETTGSEMVAVNVDTGAVDGRFADVGISGVSAAGDLAAFYASTSRETVVRLNDTGPWTANATWSVGGGEAGPDSSAVAARPNEVLAVSASKAYVLLGGRNQLGVFDPSASGASTITSFVDLSSYLSPFDTDGNIEAVAGYYVGPRKRLYLLLGSVDETQKDLVGTGYVCTKVKARVIAIDVLSNEVVPMSDGGATSVELNGYSQAERDSLVYDPSVDRLLVMSRGCNESGVIARRQVEAVNLASGEVTSVLALNDQPTPRSLVRVDSARIVIGFEGVSRIWNPALPSLGEVIPGAPELFAYDGNEGLVGVRTLTGDAGVLGLQVVRTPLPVNDGGLDGADASEAGSSTSTPVVLQAAPFSTLTGAVSRVQFWSR